MYIYALYIKKKKMFLSPSTNLCLHWESFHFLGKDAEAQKYYMFA